MGLVGKVKYYFKLKSYFNRVEDFLTNGFYTVNDKEIIKIKRSDYPFYRRFKVRGKNEKIGDYDCGRLFFTAYKSGLLTQDKAYYFLSK